MGQDKFVLVADIGATNCRLALVSPRTGALTRRTTLRTTDYAGPVQAFEAYFAQLDGDRPTQAALALACPIGTEPMRLTNCRWAFAAKDLEHALGLQRVAFINDLSAQALGVAASTAADFTALGPEGQFPFQGVTVIIGPGTGLGVAAIQHGREVPFILSSEGGHISFAPENEFEFDLMQVWRRRLGPISFEQMVSGPGLLRLYLTIAEMSGNTPLLESGPEIVAASDAGDRLSQAAVDVWCGALATFAGVSALMFNARQVVITGAIANSLRSCLKRTIFRDRFERRGPRGSYLRHAPVLLAHEPDLGLIGASALIQGASSALH